MPGKHSLSERESRHPEDNRVVAPLSDAERRAHVETFLAQSLGALYRRRRALAAFVAATAVGAAAITLMMPNQYEARARVLVPDAGSGLLNSLLGSSTARMASRFLGSGAQTGTYTRPIAILSSRRVMEAAIDSFNLIRVYDLAEDESPRNAALKELEERSAFTVDEQLEFLSIAVRDEDPARAAAISNFYIRQLNAVNTDLANQNARSYGRFIEDRYAVANRAVDSTLDAIKDFQRRYGVINLDAQTSAYFTQVGQLRAEQARLQIEAEMLRSQYGPESPQVQAAEQALAEATRQYQAALNGNEAAFPVSRGAVPQLAREYADLERELRTQSAALEVLTPMYEAAKMEEERRTETVQVVDYATPPHKKVAPKRSILVLLATLSSVLLGTVFVVGLDLWRRQGRPYLVRVRQLAP